MNFLKGAVSVIFAFFFFPTARASLVVKITQPNAVIDVNPIINFSEIQFFWNDVLQTSVEDEQFSFVQKSSGYPVYLCNDGQTYTLTTPYYNMCKSGNDNPNNQTMHIRLGPTHFNKIVIYNAYGFNNPGGFDVGNRILGATLDVMEGTVLINRYTFASVQPNYTINYPYLTDRPTLSPTLSRKPTAAPSRKPTAMPSTTTPTTKAPV